MVNTYVVAPNFSMAPPLRLYSKDEAPPPPPEAGAAPTNPIDPYAPNVELQLGDVLTLPFGAEMAAVNSKGRVHIDADDLYPIDTQEGFSTTRRELLSGRLGLWASLFAALGVGLAVNVSVFLESRTEDVIEVGELQTRRFRITDDYIDKVIKSNAIVEHLKKHPTSHIYIVSGMKVAKGVKCESKASSKGGADGGVGVGSAVADVKLLKFLWHRWTRTAFKAKSDFILAVQLWHVKLGRKEGDAAVATLSTENASLAGRETALSGLDAAQYEVKANDDSLAIATRRFGKDLVNSWGDEDGDNYVLSLPEGGGDEDKFGALM